MSDELYMQLDVVTPEKSVLSRKVTEVIAPGSAGEFGVLIGHTPFLTTLKSGQVIAKTEDKDIYLAVGGGFAEVISDRVIILAESAVLAEDIDEQKAKADLDQAQDKLKGMNKENPEYSRWESKAREAELKLKVLENWRGKS
ncbi:MAG TPA: F0F1 ATP synthase subunit epsilon [Deltaproteobacteria bacterium]|jgi:F-type H+-transporting ATPase subunit epsilon|nr:F0F1 ATP synthase subunit epsilon [Deltaproteobacteria bacterium]MDI9542973.1 F0F1 ATP synthase subunit epsilon [Pseudomonadota bacterium]HQO63268.1 F0F1 ATP synthase subunit epsilon [Syntrophorhabdus sp.]HNU76018.1 F0F1 ATP synthase subunit epsilon [Deltaproteobacteria bacterium]HOD70815.1 F0F1 ATP synthase subunit epsilon [Deltaproteobacteria bacterium]